jgi:hypothetical protein
LDYFDLDEPLFGLVQIEFGVLFNTLWHSVGRWDIFMQALLWP